MLQPPGCGYWQPFVRFNPVQRIANHHAVNIGVFLVTYASLPLPSFSCSVWVTGPGLDSMVALLLRNSVNGKPVQRSQVIMMILPHPSYASWLSLTQVNRVRTGIRICAFFDVFLKQVIFHYCWFSTFGYR